MARKRYTIKPTEESNIMTEETIDLGIINMQPVSEDLNNQENILKVPEVNADLPTALKMINKNEIPVGILLNTLTAKEPEYSTEGSACFDIFCDLENRKQVDVWIDNEVKQFKNVQVALEKDSIIIDPGERVMVPTGIIFDIPENWKILIYPRSGLALKRDLSLANSVAVIDSDYTLETFILLKNKTTSRQIIFHGDRIAQGEIVPVTRAKFSNVKEIKQKTKRNGGMGHTGT
jgi:dUTP pyrophosphatase